jgi:glycosyltransferase involved in cell wall biosynthesis
VKLVLFVPQLRSGGAQQVAVLLASGLLSLGHEVHIAMATMEGELLRRVPPGARLVDLGAGRPIRARRQLATLVDRIVPDAVICFGIYTGIATALSRRMWRCDPAVVIRNENNLRIDWRQGTALNRLIGPALSRWAARRAHIVAVSHSLAQATADFLRVPSGRVTTILNPVIDDTVPVEQNSCVSLHPWLSDGGGPVFVAMGRLEHQKGFDTLIDAFSRVRRESGARLVIFGQGSLYGVLQGRIHARGLGEAITLAGHVDHAVAQLRAAHAFVLSSRFEGFGLVVVEALWAGVHVIATRCDYGPAELLEEGRYGVLVAVDDAEALGDAMLSSLQGCNCVERPSREWFDQFAATEAARQHVALIESINAQGGRPAA